MADNMILENEDIWKIINSHFVDNPQSLVSHHIDSYNDFFNTQIFDIFKNSEPIQIYSMLDESIGDFRHECKLYIGGKNGNKIYFGKPVVYDNNESHYMFPNEARLRNMSYSMTIHYDIDVEFIDILEPNQEPYPVGINMTSIDENEINAVQDELEEELEMFNNEYENKHGVTSQKDHYENDGVQQDKLMADAELTVKNYKANGGAPKPKTKKQMENELKKNFYKNRLTTGQIEQLKQTAKNSVTQSKKQIRMMTIEKVYLGKFPIMVQSDFCILSDMPREMRYSVGECKNDVGGYFIIDGKEKTVIPQESFADNMLQILRNKNETMTCSVEMRSVSENVSKPIRTLSVYMNAPTKSYTNGNILVNIPNVRNPVPLFILFRALGVLSDKAIIQMCLLDLTKYESMIDLFIPSVHDASTIMDQSDALEVIATFTKHKTVNSVLEILSDYFLPHVGETNFTEKAYFLGYMVFRMLCVHTELEVPTDRDNIKYKRVELVGDLIKDLFREYYKIQKNEIHLEFERTLYNNKSMYSDDLPNLILKNQTGILNVAKFRSVEAGFKKAFKGNWGAYSHTKRVGVIQDLNRLSFNSMISHLRKLNLPLDSTSKIVGPRLLTGSQWGFTDPIDTPDGGNIGLHKTFALLTTVSKGYSREPMIKWLRIKMKMKTLEECIPGTLIDKTRIIVNGYWAGIIDDPIETIQKMKLFRRNALIPIHTSITFDFKLNTIFIYTDSGRICRPIFYKDEESNAFSFQDKQILSRIKTGNFTWNELTTGFNEKKINLKEARVPAIYDLAELYTGVQTEINPAKFKRFLDEKSVLDYIDPSESENALILLNYNDYLENPTRLYTHLEIHQSLILGVMCNQIIFPEHNPVTRDSFSCGQSKQAVSLYHTNYQVRMDKTAVVLNNGQIPIVKSRYLEYINHEENPYGENAIVAIMCYTGYNVEDAVLINEGALKRGLFSTTYFSMYETHEESRDSENMNSKVDIKLTNIENEPSVVGTQPAYDYSKLDEYGIVQQGTELNDKTVLIGMSSNSINDVNIRIDCSKVPKKGQLGIVDKTFITNSEEGYRIAKVRVREIRIPNLGDKMASRSGQKGTVGLIIPERDMPYTKDGLKPDIIINPHAIPSRMTIGQLVECITAKMCVGYGGFADCTAFNNDGSKIGIIGEKLVKLGYHSSGNEIMYNGMTGEPIESSIFIGPTYYMRLKHMVKDKINFRARGPKTALTRQPVSGRANDGGLRIGEMERDSLLSHGVSNMLLESMMDRGDKYYMAVCNQTGMMAIYNPAKDLFMSPMADGPIQYTGDLEEKRIQHITKYGRDFSVVCIPYSLKLLIQELQTINIVIRIITDDNINHLENMAFSKNIDKLTHIPDITPKEVMELTKSELDKSSGKPIMHNVLVGGKNKKNEKSNEKSDELVEEEFGYEDDSQPILLYTPKDTSEKEKQYAPMPVVPDIQIPESMEIDTKSKIDYVIGENVWYKNTVWTIKDKIPDANTKTIFYTIVSMDSNDVTVVQEYDLQKITTNYIQPQTIVPQQVAVPNQTLVPQQVATPNQMVVPQTLVPQQIAVPQQPQTPAANVNIKLITGNDNSTNTSTPETNAPTTTVSPTPSIFSQSAPSPSPIQDSMKSTDFKSGIKVIKTG